jgi:hypothetical protein
VSYENRFVVDLFVKLAPFVDRAADNHVLTDQPQAAASIPDLCVKLLGVPEVLRLEAKWVKHPANTGVVVTRKQVMSWQSPPTADNHTPHLWVARRADREEFFLIPFDAMADVLRATHEKILAQPPEAHDPYWKIELPGKPLREPEFWREFWGFVARRPA